MAVTDQPVSRLKQYYVLRDHQEKNIGDWHEGEIVEIDPSVAIPYIGARILVPLASAIRTKIIPPLDPKLAQQIEAESHAPSNFEAIPESSKKTLVKNTLKEAVVSKKIAQEPSQDEPVEEVILTPSEEEKPAKKELTAQEKAIQAKIAALKKNK